MKNNPLYSQDDIKTTYEDVHDLLITKYIIKEYSTNPNDIREIALNGLNLRKVKKVMEIGCGYGFFVEKLKGLLLKDAEIVGIDLAGSNREPFLNSVASIRYKGKFINESADIIKNIEESSYDLIIASYSLYFFPYLIEDISRILKPQGIFLILTHSNFSLTEAEQFIIGCMIKLGMNPPEETIIKKLFKSFSLENGMSKLQPYFSKVEKIEYNNSMIFHNEVIDDCIFYITKKKNLIFKEVIEWQHEKISEMEKCVYKSITEYTEKNGTLCINKNDAIFRCYK